MLNKKFLVTMAAVGICSALIGCAASKNNFDAAEAHTYPWAGVVVDLDNKNDLVTISTASGLEYEFYGISDLCEGDIVAVTMDDNGTPDMVLDDKIIDAKYAGCPEQLKNLN